MNKFDYLTMSDITGLLGTKSIEAFYFDLLSEKNDDSYIEDYRGALKKGCDEESAMAFADDQRTIYISDLVDAYRTTTISIFEELCSYYNVLIKPEVKKNSKGFDLVVYKVFVKISWRDSADRLKILLHDFGIDKQFSSYSLNRYLKLKKQTPKEFVFKHLFLLRRHYEIYHDKENNIDSSYVL